MLIKNINSIEEIKDILDEVASEDHRNAENYKYFKMQDRWDQYLQFHLLEDEGKPVAMGGITDFGNGLVRICDRYVTFKEYRRKELHKETNETRPVVNYFVPTQVEWALDNGYQPFMSLSSEVHKLNAIERFISMVDPKYGFRLLPDLYLTCGREHTKCHQHIITNQDTIGLEKC